MQKAKIFSLILLMAFGMSLFAVAPANAAPPNWDVTGNWVIRVYYGGNTYDHDFTLVMSSDGEFIGSGGYPAGGPYSITEDVTGTVDGDTITWHSVYNTGYEWNATGTIDTDGTISGTWTSIPAGQSGGTFGTLSGTAQPALITLTFPTGSTAVASVEILDEEDLPPCVEMFPLPGEVTPYILVTIEEGSFSGAVGVQVQYDPEDLPEGTNEEDLRLFMFNCVDFNRDGTIDGKDVALMQKAIKHQILQVPPADSPQDFPIKYDVNRDDSIDRTDLKIVQEYASQGLILNPGQDGVPRVRLPWIDITTGVNTDLNIITGETWHFSIFRGR